MTENPEHPEHPAWVQELLDDGWIIDGRFLIYPKEIVRDTLVGYFRNQDTGEVIIKTYRIINPMMSIRNLIVPIQSSPPIVTMERCRNGNSYYRGDDLCWGTLERTTENIKKIPEMLRRIAITWNLGVDILGGTTDWFVKELKHQYGSDIIESGDLF